MMHLSETWQTLFGIAGLLNPIALFVGAWLGWSANQKAKLLIAGFAAATVSIVIDAGLRLIGFSLWGGLDAGALAVFPFRFAGAAILATIVYIGRKRLAGNG